MKLYTEEQVLNMLRSFHNLEMNVQLCMLKLTPIELPSDEEVKSYSQHYSEMQEDVSDRLGKYLVKAVHMDGAQWVINKIKGGNQ